MTRVPVLLAAALLAGAAAPAAPPHWSFAAPLGGFDLGAAQRGFGLYEQHCQGCHAMRGLAPVDLLGLGYDAHTARDILAHLGHPPFAAPPAAAGDAAPDLTRAARVLGPDEIWRILLAPSAAAAYNGLPPGHPRLASGGEARDLTTFLAWSAAPHQTARRQLGVAVLVFGLVLLVAGTLAARRRSSHGP